MIIAKVVTKVLWMMLKLHQFLMKQKKFDTTFVYSYTPVHSIPVYVPVYVPVCTIMYLYILHTRPRLLHIPRLHISAIDGEDRYYVHCSFVRIICLLFGSNMMASHVFFYPWKEEEVTR